MVKSKKHYTIVLIALGVLLRYIVMLIGHNYDFESYCIVGEIAGKFRNVYAETVRYNYGPIFFCIQGILWRISQLDVANWMFIYRILMVLVLTLADLGIAGLIAKKHSVSKALLFFLNPVSIIITGYHNQFDNIAILLALITILFYNEEEKFNRKDACFVIFFSLCLMTKHIFFLLPFYLLVKDKLPLKKKIVYSIIPPSIFLLSFVPFALESKEAFEGILNNVFLYRSKNNSPALYSLYAFIGVPSYLWFIIYIFIMLAIAIIIRKRSYESNLLLYTLVMVAFSSAIVNQYLVIPMIALSVLEVGIIKYLYILSASAYLVLHGDGLNFIAREIMQVLPDWIYILSDYYLKIGYTLITWILICALIYNVIYKKNRKENTVFTV